MRAGAGAGAVSGADVGVESVGRGAVGAAAEIVAEVEVEAEAEVEVEAVVEVGGAPDDDMTFSIN
jgi:hypothetical protein